MTDIVTALGVAIEVDGSTVDRVQRYRFATGSTSQAIHRPLASDTVHVFPGQLDNGQITLELYSMPADAGQLRLWQAHQNREIMQTVMSFPAGLELNCETFVLSFPRTGSTMGVQTTNVTLRIVGAIT